MKTPDHADLFEIGLHHVLEQLATGRCLQDVLNTLVGAIEERIKGMVASVLLLDSQSQRLQHAATLNLPVEYCQLIDGLKIGPAVGSFGTAAFHNRRVIVEDTQTDPLWNDYREVAARFGLRACWSEPIHAASGKVLGTFALYYREPRLPNHEELRLIDQYAYVAGVAIEHRQTEETLRRSEARFKSLFENSPDAVFVESLEGQVLDVNKKACELHGMLREQLIGMNVLDLVPDARRMEVDREFSQIASGELTEIEGFSKRADGQIVPVSLRVSRIDDQSPPTLLLHVRDITRRKQAQEFARQQQAQLAHVSRLSTMGELVAGIAHELNQPLYAIANFAGACVKILESAGDDRSQKVRQWSEKIGEQAVRAGEILRRMREFTHKHTTNRETANLNEVLRESVELVEFEVRRLGVEVQFQLQQPDQLVLVDRIQIQQTMVNLLRNACQAMEEVAAGRRRIVVQTQVNGDDVHVSVKDTGCGLSMADSAMLFEPFYTTKSDGLGMGLAISRSIIEAHGGKLEVLARERAEAGATFRFTLPRFTEEASRDERTHRVHSGR